VEQTWPWGGSEGCGDPQAQSLPRAVVGGTLAVIAIYLLANAAYFAAFSVEWGQPARGGRNDAPHPGLGRAGGVSIAAMTQHLRRADGSNPDRPPASLTAAGAARATFSRHRPPVDEKHRSAGCLHCGAQRVVGIVVLSGSYRQLFTLRNFRKLDSLCMATAAVIVLRIKEARFTAALSHIRLSGCADFVCFGGRCIHYFHAMGFASGVDYWALP